MVYAYGDRINPKNAGAMSRVKHRLDALLRILASGTPCNLSVSSARMRKAAMSGARIK